MTAHMHHGQGRHRETEHGRHQVNGAAAESQPDDADRRLAHIALAMVTMRANTAWGEWVESDFGDAYLRLWADARELAGADAEALLFLDVLNLAARFLQDLADVSGRSVPAWLDAHRRAIDDSY